MSLLLGGDRDQLKESPASLLLGGGAFLFVYCPCVDVSASKENRYGDIHRRRHQRPQFCG